MRWLKETSHCTFACLLRRGGELVPEYARLCPTAVFNEGIWSRDAGGERFLRRFRLRNLARYLHAKSLMRRAGSKADLIYCNTIDALPALEIAARSGARVLCHVHELDFVFRAVGSVAARRVLELSDRFITCSQAVADNLVKRHGIAAELIEVVHESIPTTQADEFDQAESRRWLREKMGVGPDTMILGGSGQFGWRKGTDLFVQLAMLVRRARPDLAVHFLWLGGTLDSRNGAEFELDIETAGIGGFVTIIPSQPDPLRYFRALDLFLLTSREDPFPLVCLEAASCGIPIVCFERAGGMPEFVEQDCGAVVPYLDVQAMASAVIALLADRPKLRQCGEAARRKVLARHDIAIGGPKLLAALERTAEG
jgi:glycosyltransferase involved in cell wall biosynthesis